MALQAYSAGDPYAINDYNAALIDPSFTANLLNLGYNPTPFASREQTYQNQLGFINRLKQLLDQQMGAFDPYMGGISEANRTAALPGSLQRYFGAANAAFMDPLYSPSGAAGFFGGGWKSGQLPQNAQPAYQYWKSSTQGYPNVPAPIGAGGGGGGGGSNNLVSQFTVPLQGGGSMTVNASDRGAAEDNVRAQGGTVSSGEGRQTKSGSYQTV